MAGHAGDLMIAEGKPFSFVRCQIKLYCRAVSEQAAFSLRPLNTLHRTQKSEICRLPQDFCYLRYVIGRKQAKCEFDQGI